jgi:predicted membrane-bound mannosyltransferase
MKYQGQGYNFEDSKGLSGEKYKILGFLILSVALLIRFALLIRLFNFEERVFHHDESVHASFALKLLGTGLCRNPLK